MKHTPGPWKVGIYRKDPSRPPTIDEIKSMLCESVDRTIAHGGSIDDFYVVLSSDDPSDPIHTAMIGNGPTSVANAYFIAAAPDHFELLKLSAEFVCSLGCPAKWRTSEGQTHGELCKRIKAAIAKAEGRQS